MRGIKHENTIFSKTHHFRDESLFTKTPFITKPKPNSQTIYVVEIKRPNMENTDKTHF